MRSLSFALVSLCMLSACSRSSSDEACVETTVAPIDDSALKLARFNEPQRWAPADYSLIKSAELSPFGGTLVDTDSAAKRWLQAWTDHFDAQARTQAEQELGGTWNAPRPTVLVVESENPASVPFVPVEIQPPNADNGYGLVFTGTTPATFLQLDLEPLPKPNSWPDTSKLADFLETHAGLGKLHEQDGRYALPCHGSTVDEGLAILAVAPYVRLSIKQLRGYSELGVLTVLAHELAHIYRAHFTAGMATPRYWYDRTVGGRWEPPVGDQAALEAAYTSAEGGTGSGDSALVDKAKTNGVGFLTVESQADRVATHLLVLAGLSAEQIIEGMLDVMDDHQARGLRYDQGPSAQECRALVEQEFADADGKPVFLSIFGGAADDSVAHPGACYRIFDTVQELRAHPQTPGPRPTIDIDWGQAQLDL